MFNFKTQQQCFQISPQVLLCMSHHSPFLLFKLKMSTQGAHKQSRALPSHVSTEPRLASGIGYVLCHWDYGAFSQDVTQKPASLLPQPLAALSGIKNLPHSIYLCKKKSTHCYSNTIFTTQTSTLQMEQLCHATCNRAKLVDLGQLQNLPSLLRSFWNIPHGVQGFVLSSFPRNTPLPHLPLTLGELFPLTSQGQGSRSSPEQHDVPESIPFPPQTEGKRREKDFGKALALAQDSSTSQELWCCDPQSMHRGNKVLPS